MKVKIVDFGLFQKSNGYEFSRDLNSEYVFDVYAIITSKKTRYVLLYISNIQVLNFFKLNGSLQIIDNRTNSKWCYTKSYSGGTHIYYSGGSYFQTIRYKDVNAPEWMISDKRFFLELIEKPEIAREKFFQNEGTNMIR
ncbi:MAG TPA: hypothetical protein PLM51_04640 [Bacillota bacterium]|nr:hypothetical protein [Bacillota bacterium]